MSQILHTKYIYNDSGKVIEVILPYEEFKELQQRAGVFGTQQELKAKTSTPGTSVAPGREKYTEPAHSGNTKATPIEDILAKLADEVAPSEWDKLPVDLSANLDFYLYGQSK